MRAGCARACRRRPSVQLRTPNASQTLGGGFGMRRVCKSMQAQAKMPAQNGAQHDIASAEASAQRHEVERNLMSYVIWVENAVINDLFFGARCF